MDARVCRICVGRQAQLLRIYPHFTDVRLTPGRRRRRLALNCEGWPISPRAEAGVEEATQGGAIERLRCTETLTSKNGVLI